MENQISLLVVDDEQIVLDSIAKHLRHEKDLSLSKALSVEEALGIMDEKKVQIILTDLMMPDIDGLEFLSMMMKKDEDIPGDYDYGICYYKYCSSGNAVGSIRLSVQTIYPRRT
jgi:DNA-binding NtrC family response regulator